MRFPVLDGWRGICALLVALFHLNALGHFYSVSFVRGSYLFVDFFFVLSGFVITHAYSDRLGTVRQAGTFLIRRFGRVWPLHAVVLLAFVPLEILKALAAGGYGATVETAAFAGRYAPSAIFSNLTLVHSLGVESELTWNMPSWSISAEFLTYLTFALTALVFRRSITVAAAILAIAGAFILLNWSGNHIDVSFDYGYFRCLYGFFVGHIVYAIHLHGRTNGLTGLRNAGAVETATLLLVAVFVSMAEGSALSYAAPLVFGLAVWVFAFEGGYLSRLLTAGPVQAIGAWSYSIYMVHALIIAVLQKGAAVAQSALGKPLVVDHPVGGHDQRLLWFGDLWVMDAVAAIYLLVVILVSAVTYRLVERPGQSLFNGLLSRSRKTAPVRGAAGVA